MHAIVFKLKGLRQFLVQKFIVHKHHFLCAVYTITWPGVHNIKAKKLKYDHYALYARLKSTVFSSCLKALWLVISWSDMGSGAPCCRAGERKASLAQLEESQVIHIIDCSQNGAGNEMRCWRLTWLVQTYTTDCIRYESRAMKYTVWMSLVVRQEAVHVLWIENKTNE